VYLPTSSSALASALPPKSLAACLAPSNA